MIPFLLFDFSTDEASDITLPTGLPSLFQALFGFMEGGWSVYRGNFMRNGAGKLLLYNLLSVAKIGLVKLLTTTDPRTDWCGYPQSERSSNLYGDIIIVRLAYPLLSSLCSILWRELAALCTKSLRWVKAGSGYGQALLRLSLLTTESLWCILKAH